MREQKVAALILANKLIDSQLDSSSCPLEGSFQISSSHCRRCPKLMPCSWLHHSNKAQVHRRQTNIDEIMRSEAELDRNLALAQMLIQRAVDTDALTPDDYREALGWLTHYATLTSRATNSSKK